MVEFFGSVDKNRRGEVSSDMPAWYFDVHVDEMEEDIARRERELASDKVPPEYYQMKKNQVSNLKEKLSEIKASKPILKGGLKTKFANEYHKLQNRIADSMPTRMEDRNGFVSPREELARWNTPHIDIDPEIATSCGMKHVKGKITGKQADKIYKMIGKHIGENTNIERIRKEGKSQSQRDMEEYTAHILEKFSKVG